MADTEPTNEPALDDVFGKKKKKRKPKTESTQEQPDSTTASEAQSESSSAAPQEKEGKTQSTDQASNNNADAPSYAYEELLNRLYNLLQKPTDDKGPVKIKVPIVQREGNVKTAWVNFPQTCTSMNRSPEHVMQFFLAETATTGSIDGSGRFIIRGRFQEKHIQKILKSYILEYVQCPTCKSLDTFLHKENRINFLKCRNCGVNRSVAQIKQGFQATTKATRKSAKEAEQK
eukprot:CAMPEP_0168556768 /NCGR_PEP_ID=MMETSP0413-20121227/9059_1 /TAXON_ID=136452 /ORGANISM="Filamoeba nolandi, Strain NC-AS-23-1" /LENGTH=230 /DNA_ID=CAMNT_0008587737 /DNA_START=112 /DNA_END=804 /DNA_ORIENTATION=-